MKRRMLAALILGAVPGLITMFVSPIPAATQNRPPTLQEALRKTSVATTYRVQLTISAAGLNDETRASLSDPGVKTTTKDTLRLLTLASEAGSSNVSISYQNPLLSAALGIVPSQSVEMLVTPRTLFVRGPLPEAGAPRPIWYRADRTILRGPIATLQEESDLAKKLKVFAEINTSWIRQSRTETYESVNCAVYTSSDPALIVTGLGSLGLSPMTALLDGQLHSATLEFFACADGYIRQMHATINATPAEKTRDPITMTVSMIVRDFDNTITLNPPGGAVQLTLPPVTPTPTALPGTPTPGPTTIAPTATPVPIPLEATVLVQCTLRAEPLPRGEAVGQAEAEQTLQLAATTTDGRWYKVTAADGTVGWAPAMFLRIAPAAAVRVPVEK
jgi:hypothetical protein